METNIVEIPESTPSQDISSIKRKTHFTGTVLKTTLAGAVIDIGLDTPGVVHISQLQAQPVNRVEDIIHPGQSVEVWVRRVFPKKRRIELTMIEPLGLEWREIEQDMVVRGKVIRLEKFGAFVDIGAERPGLVHISELAHDYVKDPSEVVHEGDEIEVKVLSVNRQKKQIKLSMKALTEPPVKVVKETRQPQPQTPVVKEPEVQEEKEQPVPTAMEMALREAMERSQEQQSVRPARMSVRGKRKSQASENELEDILMRTLQHKRK